MSIKLGLSASGSRLKILHPANNIVDTSTPRDIEILFTFSYFNLVA